MGPIARMILRSVGYPIQDSPALPGPDLTLTAAYRAADIAHARTLIAQATRDLDVWQETGAEPSRLAALALLDQATRALRGDRP